MSRSIDRLQDEISILEYRAGDAGALEKLITRWQSRLYYYVLSMVQEESEAWDVYQEIWLAVISKLGRLRRVESFSTWLYRIAHNQTVSHLQKKGRLDRNERNSSESVETGGEPDADILCSVEDARLVRECFRKLPWAQRETLSLYYLEDFSVDEIARVQKVPIGTVQSRLHYGRIRMKELLLKEGYSHDSK